MHDVVSPGVPEESVRPVRLWEMLTLGIVAAVLVVCCIDDSGRRLFWLDEVFTGVAVGDASFSHMLGGLKDEINTSPPLYFILGWIWVRLFGASDLSLRLPSAICTAVAIVAFWAGLRRFARPWIAMVCAIAIPLLCWPMRFNISEARCYALYLAAYAVAVALYLRCDESKRRTWIFYGSVVLAHGILVATHYVGGLYSAALVATALASWILGRNVVFLRYACCAVASWLAVIPSLPFLMVQSKLTGKDSWIPRPSMIDLLEQYSGNIHGFELIATLLLTAWLVAESIDAPPRRGRAVGAAAWNVAMLMLVAIAFLPAVWLESRWEARIFISRYLFLDVIAWGCVIAWTLERLCERLWGAEAAVHSTSGEECSRRDHSLRWLGRALVCAVFAIVIAGAATSLGWHRANDRSDMLRSDLAAASEFPDVPILTNDIDDFAPLAYYLEAIHPVFMLTDEWYRGLPIGIRHGQALERHYFPGSMTELGEFLAKRDRFLMVAGRRKSPSAIEDDPVWEGRKINDRVSLWERRNGN